MMHQTRSSAHASAPARRVRAFTLIELLVVMAIIVILLSISFPAYRKMTSDTGKKQSITSVSVQIATARSLALGTQRQVGVVFFEDPLQPNTTSMVLVQAVSEGSNGATLFGGFPDRPPVRLPRFVQVATVSAATSNGTVAGGYGATAAQRFRAIVFDENGRPVQRDRMVAYNSGTDPRNAFPEWGLAASAPGVGHTSAISFIVYDAQELNEAAQDDAARVAWLLTNAEMISINPHTGLVLR